ncbi:MAG: Hpt domain-containing protein [Thermodesulfobacteriota bacterium]
MMDRTTGGASWAGGRQMIFNRQLLLERLLGDHDLLATIVSSFQSDTRLRLDELKVTLAQGDVEAATRLAHTIKGSSANVGGEALSNVAQDLERLGRAGHLREMNRQISQLDSCFSQFCAELGKERGASS